MNILIVEDEFELKVKSALEYLNSKNLKFRYKHFSCVSEGLKYLDKKLSEVDLIILDLGLPWFDGVRVSNGLEGLRILDHIGYEDISTPVIINSTTTIKGDNGETEEEILKKYEIPKIKHVKHLEGNWLYNFIQKNCKQK